MSVTKQKPEEILRREGFKATSPRIAVLKALQSSSKPLTVQEIVGKIGKQVDQATVYRTLEALVASRVVRIIELRHGHAHYELRDEEDHHHIVCTKCSRIEDIHECIANSMLKKVISQSNFASVTDHSLEFFGICKNCS